MVCISGSAFGSCHHTLIRKCLARFSNPSIINKMPWRASSFLGPTPNPRDSDSAGLGWGRRIFLLNLLQVMLMLPALSQTTPWGEHGSARPCLTHLGPVTAPGVTQREGTSWVGDGRSGREPVPAGAPPSPAPQGSAFKRGGRCLRLTVCSFDPRHQR